MPFSFIDRFVRLGRICCFHLLWSWKQQTPSKKWYLTVQVFGVATVSVREPRLWCFGIPFISSQSMNFLEGTVTQNWMFNLQWMFGSHVWAQTLTKALWHRIGCSKHNTLLEAGFEQRLLIWHCDTELDVWSKTIVGCWVWAQTLNMSLQHRIGCLKHNTLLALGFERRPLLRHCDTELDVRSKTHCWKLGLSTDPY